jgi:DNA-binding NarL/FixJ family response regulator
MTDTTPTESRPPYRVLICDDALMSRRALQRALRDNSEFQVVDEAAGGQESIAKAVKLKPDLVLMDVCMPDLNGIEATRQILRAAPGTKVLAYSADSAWGTVDRMFAAGADGYLVKGADVDELVRAARTVLAGGHYLSVVLLESTGGATEDN